ARSARSARPTRSTRAARAARTARATGTARAARALPAGAGLTLALVLLGVLRALLAVLGHGRLAQAGTLPLGEQHPRVEHDLLALLHALLDLGHLVVAQADLHLARLRLALLVQDVDPAGAAHVGPAQDGLDRHRQAVVVVAVGEDGHLGAHARLQPRQVLVD